MRLVVVGTGYVGLVSGVCLAAKGHHVSCVDIDQNIIESLNQGEPHIYENGLSGLLKDVIETKHFRATTNLVEVLGSAELVIIAVGTPSDNGAIDLSHIKVVARSIGAYIKSSGRSLVVVVKSTVIPGTTDTIVKEEIEAASGQKFPNFGLGMNPEFLREGEAIDDFMEPDRIVMGHEDIRALKVLEELYAPWSCEKIRVNTRTAELIKYANNALLATQISTINEIANLAAALGNIDSMDVVRGVTLDKRWSPFVDGRRVSPSILSYLIPGCGFGGSCFPKDVQALRSQGTNLGLEMLMLNSVLDVNDAQPQEVVNILVRELGDLAGLSILVLGLAFKPGTDDVRGSASLKIVASLLQQNAFIAAHDPAAINNFKEAIVDVKKAIKYVSDWQAQVEKAEIIIITSKWPEYDSLADMDTHEKVVFDARRMFSPSDFTESKYLTIGRNMARL